MTAIGAALRSRTSVVLGETLINAVLALATYAVILRITDLATVGLWALISSVMGLARSVDIWSRGVSTFVAQARVVEGDEEAATYVSTAAISGAAGYGIVTLVAAPLLLASLGLALDPAAERQMVDLLPLMLVGFWLTSLGGVYQLGFLGFERPALKAAQTVGGSVLFLAGTIILAPAYGLRGMIIAQIIQGIAMLGFAIVVFHGSMMRGRSFRLFERQRVMQLITFGSKAIGLGAMQLLTEPILRLIANHFGGLAGVGLVDFASRLCQIPRQLIGSIGQTLVPAFARTAGSAAAEQKALFDHGRAMIVPLSTALMTGVIGCGYGMAWLAIGTSAIEASAVTALLAVGWLANLVTSTEYFMHFGRRHLRIVTISHVAMIAGMAALGVAGGMIGGFLGAIGGAMAGVALSSLTLVTLSTDAPSTFGTERKDEPRTRVGYRRCLLLAVFAMLILLGQMTIASWSGWQPLYTSIFGVIVTGLLVAWLTPWQRLISLAGTMDRVGTTQLEEGKTQ